jgi:alkaline phosphatase D
MKLRRPALTRRELLSRSASLAALAGSRILAKPYLSRAADRPQIRCGVQSGDVDASSAVVWSRADRPSRMRVATSTVESFKTILGAASADAQPDCDLAAKLALNDLPAGQDIFYRVWFEDIASGVAGEARIGRFRTAPRGNDSISFVWSGDVAGQGWGIDIARGGYRSYRTMLANRPDFFIHSRAQLCHRGEVGGRPQPPAVSRPTTATTGSTRTFVPFMRKYPCSRNGTIMR